MAERKFTKVPAFQFYPKDYLADPNVMAMTWQQRGIYVSLICICWQQGSIPNDATALARVCQMDAVAFATDWMAIKPCFKIPKKGSRRLIHPRLERERKKQQEYREARSDAGKRGATARWGKHAQAMRPHSDGNATALRFDASSSSSSSSSSDLKRDLKKDTVHEWCHHANGCPNRAYHDRIVLMEERNAERIARVTRKA